MALAGKKTVMLEFDIRKPKLFSGMKLTSKQGITNFLVGKAEMEDLPIRIPGYDNLFGIKARSIVSNIAFDKFKLAMVLKNCYITIPPCFKIVQNFNRSNAVIVY